jgi:hypothetical protein
MSCTRSLDQIIRGLYETISGAAGAEYGTGRLHYPCRERTSTTLDGSSQAFREDDLSKWGTDFSIQRCHRSQSQRAALKQGQVSPAPM